MLFASYMMLTVIVIKEQRHKPERKRHKCVWAQRTHSHIALNVMTFAFQCFPEPDDWPFASAFPVDEPKEEAAIQMCA